MTCDPTRRHNRIDSPDLDGSTDHTPEGMDIAKPQAEQDGQKAALKFPHVDGLAWTSKGRAKLKRQKGWTWHEDIDARVLFSRQKP